MRGGSIKQIVIMTKSQAIFYDLEKNDRPLTIVANQLYRTDLEYRLRDVAAPHEIVVYDYDGIIPYGVPDPPSPDETMAYIDVTRSSARKLGKLRVWPKWLNARNIVIAFVILAVTYNYLT